MTTRTTVVGKVQRKEQALRLCEAGHSFAAIGAELGISKARAHQLVIEALDEARDVTLDTTAHLRQLHLERLSQMHAALWPYVVDTGEKRKDGKPFVPSLDAVNRCLTIMERIEKLHGIGKEEPGLSVADVLSYAAEIAGVVKKYITDPEVRYAIVEEVRSLRSLEPPPR